MKGTSSESYALHVEHLSSTVNLTGARKSTRSDPTVQTILDTSLSDNQEDATSHDVIIESDDNEQQAARHSPLAADDQCKLPDELQTGAASRACHSGNELPNDACPPLFGCDNRYQHDRAVLPPVQPEIDKKERRYSNDRYDVGIHQHVVVHSTRLSLFQSDAYGERCISQECFPANHDSTHVRLEKDECFQANHNLVTARPEEQSIHEAGNIHSPPGVVRSRQVAMPEPDLEQDIDLNESADLFLEESQWSTTATRGDSTLSTRSISRDRTAGTISPENFASSLLLLPFPPETGSPNEIRSNREMTSPSCMASRNLNTGPADVWTGDNSAEETTTVKYTQNKYVNHLYENIHTGNGNGDDGEERAKVTGLDRTSASATFAQRMETVIMKLHKVLQYKRHL